MEFEKKTVIVTGSTRGIGRAIAEAFAKEGANVVLAGTSDVVFQAKSELQDKGYSIEAVKGDISRHETAQKIIDTAVESFGCIDILVNNAGITKDTFLIKMKDEDWDSVMDTNLKGAFLCTRAAAKPMMKKRSGKIINITSVVGLMGNASQVNYVSSKAGLIGLTKSVAKELGGRGITCNAVAPGFIETKMTDDLPEEVKKSYLSNVPLKRYGTPDEVAHLVLFLASEKANYITGQVITVDGGLYM